MQKINPKNKYLCHPTKYCQQGFMMIEAVFSIFIVGTTLITFLAVLCTLYQTEFGKRDYVIASNLAQEGIELVRNIRDNNWKRKMNDGFVAPFPDTDTHCVDYLGTSRDCATKLKRNAGFYEYTNGTETKFSRRITITKNGDARTIRCTVTWKPSGTLGIATIEMEDTLYAWADPE